VQREKCRERSAEREVKGSSRKIILLM
jgi:hypothetical protein